MKLRIILVNYFILANILEKSIFNGFIDTYLPLENNYVLIPL